MCLRTFQFLICVLNTPGSYLQPLSQGSLSQATQISCLDPLEMRWYPCCWWCCLVLFILLDISDSNVLLWLRTNGHTIYWIRSAEIRENHSFEQGSKWYKNIFFFSSMKSKFYASVSLLWINVDTIQKYTKQLNYFIYE